LHHQLILIKPLLLYHLLEFYPKYLPYINFNKGIKALLLTGSPEKGYRIVAINFYL
jgi:hypothetical protein